MMYKVWVDFLDDGEPLFTLADESDDEILHLNGAAILALIRADNFPKALHIFNKVVCYEMGYTFLVPTPPIG